MAHIHSLIMNSLVLIVVAHAVYIHAVMVIISYNYIDDGNYNYEFINFQATKVHIQRPEGGNSVHFESKTSSNRFPCASPAGCMEPRAQKIRYLASSINRVMDFREDIIMIRLCF